MISRVIYRILLAVAFIGAACSICQAQSSNCSTGSYTLTGEVYDQPPCHKPPSTITDTKTYFEKCTTIYGNSTPGQTYWTANSTITGYGQNYCGFLTGTTTCPPYMYFYETDGGTSGSDYYANRFYNQAYDYGVAVGNYCAATGGWRQDFKQCLTAPCDAVSGGGGGGSPDPSGGATELTGGEVASPIIIDISGKGFLLTNAANGVKFDIFGTGAPIQMGWTTPSVGNAFLALPGADGLIHSGKQLFGNFTPQPSSATPNGFAALAVYDLPANGGNGNGIIDSGDAIFASLRLWIDANHDGISQPEELHALPALGVSSISLNYKWDRRTDQYGNVLRYHAQVNPGDPTNTGRMAYDVFFVTDLPLTKNIPTSLIPVDGHKCPIPVPSKG